MSYHFGASSGKLLCIIMKKNHTTDWFILNLVSCPSCNNKLIPKPVQGDIKNVFCENCDFSCRFETIMNHPDESIFSIYSGDLSKLLSDKVTLPPFIFHFKWMIDGVRFEKIYFFPFIAHSFLKERKNYPIGLMSDDKEEMIFYSNFFILPHILLFEQPSVEDMAEIVSNYQKISTSFIQRKFGVGYARASMIKEIVTKIRRKKGIFDEIINEDDDDEEDEEDEW